MWVSFIQSVEDFNRTKTDLPWPRSCSARRWPRAWTATSALPWVSSLPAHVGLTSFHNHRCQFLKINLFIYVSILYISFPRESCLRQCPLICSHLSKLLPHYQSTCTSSCHKWHIGQRLYACLPLLFGNKDLPWLNVCNCYWFVVVRVIKVEGIPRIS